MMSDESIIPVSVLYPVQNGTIETDVPMLGKGHPNGEVLIFNVPSNDIIEHSDVDSEGNWSETFPGIGERTVKFSQLVNGTIYVTPGEFKFKVDPAPPPAPHMLYPKPNESDVSSRGGFLVDAGRYNEVDRVVLEVREAGGKILWEKDMYRSVYVYRWALELAPQDRLAVGYYITKAWTIKNGVESRSTSDVPFSVGMPT
jgi:hypothetical protein